MRWLFSGMGMLSCNPSIVAAAAKVLQQSATPEMQCTFALGSFKGGQIGELDERRRAAKTGGVASTGRVSNVIMMEVGMRFSALRILYFPLTRASRIQITFMQYAAVAAVEIHLLWIEPVHHPPPGHYLVDGGNADGFGAVPVALLDARGVLEF